MLRYFEKLDPDPHWSEKLDPDLDPHLGQHPGPAQNKAVEARDANDGGVKAQNGAVEGL